MVTMSRAKSGTLKSRPVPARPGWQNGTPETLDDLYKHQAINWINNNSRKIQPRTFTTPEGIAEITLPGKLVVDNSEAYIAAGGRVRVNTGDESFLQPYIDRGQLVEVLPEHSSRIVNCRFSIHTAISPARCGPLPSGWKV